MLGTIDFLLEFVGHEGEAYICLINKKSFTKDDMINTYIAESEYNRVFMRQLIC